MGMDCEAPVLGVAGKILMKENLLGVGHNFLPSFHLGFYLVFTAYARFVIGGKQSLTNTA